MSVIENIIGYTAACGFACLCAFVVMCGYMTLTGDADHVTSLLNAKASITANSNVTTTSDIVSEPVSEDPFNFVYEEQPEKIEYVGADGHIITLVQNSSAVNPTYDQVISFLKSDTTDQVPYDLKKFTCGDYAEHVQHNAEATGYQCGWVFIELDDGNHACDVFNTTDRGLVFVDSTAFDSVVDVKEGSEYHPIPLSKLLGYNSGVSADSIGVVKSFTIKW